MVMSVASAALRWIQSLDSSKLKEFEELLLTFSPILFPAVLGTRRSGRIQRNAYLWRCCEEAEICMYICLMKTLALGLWVLLEKVCSGKGSS